MLDISKVKTIFQIFLMVAMLSLAVMPAFAQVPSGSDDDQFGIKAVGGETGLGGSADTDLRVTIGNIIKIALSFLGVVAIVIVLIGGFKYMTAGGSDEKTGEARKYIISGIIGLAIILSAYAITSFVLGQLLKATTE